jgi:predicted nucleotidyltransferase
MLLPKLISGEVRVNIEEEELMTVEEIKSIITPLVSPYPISRVILFGSYARGEATDGSDVDLIIDSEGRLSGFDYFGIAGLIMKNLPIKADVFELREINKPSTMFDNIRKEGVVIYESKNTQTA